jgi:N-acetyl-gamma-glutamyl-phosphate reductase
MRDRRRSTASLHPEFRVVAPIGLARRQVLERSTRLNGSLPPFVKQAEALAAGADVTFLCLGHEEAAAVQIAGDGIVVDLSGAHRLDAGAYPEWYGFEHPAAGTLGDWSYALPELWPPAGRLIANPGCYATAALLALAPLADAIDHTGVVVDAKSGVSGAGRTPKAGSHAGFVLENLSAYKVGAHQHAPEMAQALGFPVTFVPHLLPSGSLLATLPRRQ